MIFPIEIYQNENGSLTKDYNPKELQVKYVFEISLQDKAKNNGKYADINYYSFFRKKYLPSEKIIEFLKNSL